MTDERVYLTGERSLKHSIYPGFDYLRAIMSIAVVAWHTHLFGASKLFDRTEFLSHSFGVSDLINFHLLLCAVPGFFLISIFLFSQRSTTNSTYFRKRMEKLIYLYLFWSILIIVWREGANGLLVLVSCNPSKLLATLVTGGHSVFFFFFTLIILTCVSNTAVKLSTHILWILVIFSALLLWLMPIIVIKTDSYSYLTAYWNPLNFIVYVFIAVLVSKRIEGGLFEPGSVHFRIFLGILLVIFVATSTFEWQWMVHESNFASNGYGIPAYTRISVVIGALLAFLLGFYFRRPPGPLIKFLSKESLGLYCIHPFILNAYNAIISNVNSPLNIFIKFLSVLVLSYGVAYLARRMFAKGLI